MQLEAEAEAARQAQVQEEYERAMPDDVKKRVQRVVEKEISRLKTTLEMDYRDEIAKLRAQIAAAPAPRVPSARA